MKTYKTPSTSKLVARFDTELKNLLSEDLKNFRAKNKIMNINQQPSAQQTLSAA
ncbi:hypothetical protein [Mucilaginibacter sp. SP1R1]|uniref:hypothetical protein n=1 Tax=Mucilaginibacter sp. SP1R1 TaxID=2723091 RepID=UPI00160B6D1F|nr:hypothetical protein [Mucilaginibacter sp. SP1R1]MBB6152144.1 hypothetical protein [Mucilaginibacter sp. SP1R1]